MSVSNEDRDTAALVLGQHYIDMEMTDRAQDADHCTCGPLIEDWDRHYIDALVGLGWGPRPTVTRDAIVDHVAHLEVPRAPIVDGVLKISAESMADALIPFLRECGIEVTHD